MYSTCTMAPEENELVLKRALKRYAGRIEIEPLPTTLPTAIPALCAWRGKELPALITEFARRIPPGPEWDGFFIARIRKSTG